MVALASVLVILAGSVLITRIATVALTHTGMSRESARFQARSSFTGVGFTTREAEQVVDHPVRRRIAMLLMLLGNAGIVSVMASLVLTLVQDPEVGLPTEIRFALLVLGIGALWLLARSRWVDRWLSGLIDWALDRWTDLEVSDYVALLRLSGAYQVRELQVGADDWIADRTLAQLELRREGVQVLGIVRDDGSYVGVPRGDTAVESGDTLILYGRAESLNELDRRVRGGAGDREHEEAVARQERVDSEERARDRQRRSA